MNTTPHTTASSYEDFQQIPSHPANAQQLEPNIVDGRENDPQYQAPPYPIAPQIMATTPDYTFYAHPDQCWMPNSAMYQPPIPPMGMPFGYAPMMTPAMVDFPYFAPQTQQPIPLNLDALQLEEPDDGYFKTITLAPEQAQKFFDLTQRIIVFPNSKTLSYAKLVGAAQAPSYADEQWHLTGEQCWSALSATQSPSDFKPHIQRYCQNMEASIYALLKLLMPNDPSLNRSDTAPNIERGHFDRAADMHEGAWSFLSNGGITLTTPHAQLSLVPSDANHSVATHVLNDIELYPFSHQLKTPLDPSIAHACQAFGLRYLTEQTLPLYMQSPKDSHWLRHGHRLGPQVSDADQRKPLSQTNTETLLNLLTMYPGHTQLFDMARNHLQTLNDEKTLANSSYSLEDNSIIAENKTIDFDSDATTISALSDNSNHPPTLSPQPEVRKTSEKSIEKPTESNASKTEVHVEATKAKHTSPAQQLPSDWSTLNTLTQTKKWIKAQKSWPKSLIEDAKKNAPLPVRALICAHLVEHYDDPFSAHQIHHGLMSFTDLMICRTDPQNSLAATPFSLPPSARDALRSARPNQDPNSYRNRFLDHLDSSSDTIAHTFAKIPTRIWITGEKSLIRDFFQGSDEKVFHCYEALWHAGKNPTKLIPAQRFAEAIDTIDNEKHLNHILPLALRSTHQLSATERAQILLPLALKLEMSNFVWNELLILFSNTTKKGQDEWDKAVESVNINDKVHELLQKNGAHWYLIDTPDSDATGQLNALKHAIAELESFETFQTDLNSDIIDSIVRYGSLGPRTKIHNDELITLTHVYTRYIILKSITNEFDPTTVELMKEFAKIKLYNRPLHEQIAHYGLSIFDRQRYENQESLPIYITAQRIVVEYHQSLSESPNTTNQEQAEASIALNASQPYFDKHRYQNLENITEHLNTLKHLSLNLLDLCEISKVKGENNHHQFLATVPHGFAKAILRTPTTNPREQLLQITIALNYHNGKDKETQDLLKEKAQTLKEQLTENPDYSTVGMRIDESSQFAKIYRHYSTVPNRYLAYWPNDVRDALNELFKLNTTYCIITRDRP